MPSSRTVFIYAVVVGATLASGSVAFAQSSASTYSYGTYNPVQAAINRDSMNAAIIRQATGKSSKSTVVHQRRKTPASRHR